MIEYYIAVVATVIVIHQFIQTNLLGRIFMKFQELIQKFDAATNEVSARLSALFAAIKASSGEVTAEQETESNALIARLNSFGADPNNPFPGEPVVEPVPPVDPLA